MNELLSRPAIQAALLIAALLVLVLAWKFLRVTMRMFIVLALVATIVVGVLWLKGR